MFKQLKYLIGHVYCSQPILYLLEKSKKFDSFLNEAQDSNPPDPPVCLREGWLHKTLSLFFCLIHSSPDRFQNLYRGSSCMRFYFIHNLFFMAKPGGMHSIYHTTQ